MLNHILVGISILVLTIHKFNDLVISLSLQENYGTLEFGNNEKIVVEHTSVNPNKALHVGHIRNIILGDVVSKILKKANYDVKCIKLC